MAASGIMVSFDVLTAAPAEVGPCPVLASALVKALRAELALSVVTALALDVADDRGVPDAAVIDDAGGAIGVATVPVVVAAVTVPPGAFVVAVPRGEPPVVAT